jgi:uncharacterized protein YaaQ
MILAVIQDRDAGPTLDALCEHKFGVTQIASTGSFWHQGNVTLLIGVSEQGVEEAIGLLREQCHRRQEPRAGAGWGQIRCPEQSHRS